MNFSITSKLDTKAYIKVMYIGLYKKPYYIFATLFAFYLLATVILDKVGVIYFYDETPWLEFIAGFVLLLSPTIITLISVRQFKSNPSFGKEMQFTFNDEGITTDGLTFHTNVTWAHIIKQKEIGKFLVLYHTKKFGNFIEKEKLSAEQILFIKQKIKTK